MARTRSGMWRRARVRLPVLFLVALAAVAIALPTTGSAATTQTWRAKVGASGANGVATLTATGSTGTLKLALKALTASTAYPVKIVKGTCAAPGSTLWAAATQTSTSAGKITKSLAVPAAKLTAIRAGAAAGPIAIRVGSGSKIRCGPFTGGPAPTPTPTATPEPSLAAAIGRTAHLGYSLYDIAADDSGVWAVELLVTYAYKIDPATGAELKRVDYSATLEVTLGCAMGAGAVWVATNRLDGGGGSIVRIDPTTGSIPARIEVAGHVLGVTTGGGSVWVAQSAPDQLVRIDPAKNAVTKVYPVKSVPVAVAYGGGFGWLASGDSLLKVNLATSDVTTIALGGQARELTFADGAVWVTVPGTGMSPAWKLVRVAADTGAIVARVDLPAEPWDVSGGSGYVWVAPNDNATPWGVAVSTASNRVVASVTLPKALSAVAVRGRSAWFAGSDADGGLVVRVDW